MGNDIGKCEESNVRHGYVNDTTEIQIHANSGRITAETKYDFFGKKTM